MKFFLLIMMMLIFYYKRNTGNKKKGKNSKTKPIELLDDGYFGNGIYFTKYSDYA